MKVAHLITTFLPKTGGAEITVHNLLAQQHKGGVDVTGVVPWRAWRAMRELVPYRLVPLLPATAWLFIKADRSHSIFRFLLAQQLQLIQRRYDFDLWHVHMAYIAGILMTGVLPKIKTPAILTCHGEDIMKLPEIGYGVRLDPRIDRLVVESLYAFDRLTAVSESVRHEYQRVGIPAARIRDVPNGVDTARFQQFGSDRLKTRMELNWPNDKKVLLTVGRNHPVKGYHLIPLMIEKLLQSRSDFLWVIVGRGTEAILEQARQLGVDHHLQVYGQIGSGSEQSDLEQFVRPPNQIIHLYRAADLFVFPSLSESFGIVLVEAMAAGLPVITTDAPGCRDIVEDEINGLLSPAGDSGRMVANILGLFDDIALCERLAEAGRKSAEKYDWQQVALSYLDLYRELL